jgi:hypothetical protein
MNIPRILSLFLLLAACSRVWIPVAPGTAPMDCTALRLSARGWTVDAPFTDSTHLRVVKREGASVDTVTAEILFPPDTSFVRVESDWWAGKANARQRVGSNLAHEMEVMDAMESCRITVYGSRRVALGAGPAAPLLRRPPAAPPSRR